MFGFCSGDTNYIFDGNFAARLPRSTFKENWQESFTIAGWLYAKPSQHPQFILSLSDGKKFGDTYVGLYVVNKLYDEQPRIGFIMNKENGKCKSHVEWEVALGDTRWRHIAVIVEGCNLQVSTVYFSLLASFLISHSFLAITGFMSGFWQFQWALRSLIFCF